MVPVPPNTCKRIVQTTYTVYGEGMQRNEVGPDNIRTGMSIIAVDGRAVPEFTVSAVQRRRVPLTGRKAWNVYRRDQRGKRIELTLYDSDRVEVRP